MSSKAKVNYAAFKLCGIDFSAMDNAFDVDFSFNEVFSLTVNLYRKHFFYLRVP